MSSLPYVPRRASPLLLAACAKHGAHRRRRAVGRHAVVTFVTNSYNRFLAPCHDNTKGHGASPEFNRLTAPRPAPWLR